MQFDAANDVVLDFLAEPADREIAHRLKILERGIPICAPTWGGRLGLLIVSVRAASLTVSLGRRLLMLGRPKLVDQLRRALRLGVISWVRGARSGKDFV